MRVIGLQSKMYSSSHFPHNFCLICIFYVNLTSMMFSRLILFLLLVVLDFRPCLCHWCSYLPEGFLHATPTRPVAALLAKLARKHRGTCKKAERTNLNCERCTQVFSFSTKGKKLHPLSLWFLVFCVITQVSQSPSHTYVRTHTHDTDPPFLAVEVTDFCCHRFSVQEEAASSPTPRWDLLQSHSINFIKFWVMSHQLGPTSNFRKH